MDDQDVLNSVSSEPQWRKLPENLTADKRVLRHPRCAAMGTPAVLHFANPGTAYFAPVRVLVRMNPRACAQHRTIAARRACLAEGGKLPVNAHPAGRHTTVKMKPPLRRQGRRRDTSARARALQAGNVSRNASAAILRETQRSDWQRLLEDQPTCATDGPRAQRCFEERIDQLAAAYFSRLRNQTITTQALLTAAETSRRHCMLIRLHGGHVLIDDSWKSPRASLWYNGRFTDVACLLEYAASRNMSLPKRADLLVCGSDGLSGSDSDALHGVPALTLTHQPRCPSCIPVPMASRGYVSDLRASSTLPSSSRRQWANASEAAA